MDLYPPSQPPASNADPAAEEVPPRTNCATCGRPITRELVYELFEQGKLRGDAFYDALDVWVSDDGRCSKCVDAGREVPDQQPAA